MAKTANFTKFVNSQKSWGLRALFDTFFHGFEIYFRILTGANIPATRGTDRGFRENTHRPAIASSGSHLRTLISGSRMLRFQLSNSQIPTLQLSDSNSPTLRFQLSNSQTPTFKLSASQIQTLTLGPQTLGFG